MIVRRHCPVFVMGVHRSGTNLLYDTLMSAGGFAIYRGYLPVHKVLIPRFGQLDRLENRKRMMATWLRSKGFRRSGLNAEEVTARVLNDCQNGGDFLRIVMGEIARDQQVERWAFYDPDTALRVDAIKKDLPEALFVHIIRDGRDIALSLRKMGGFNPFPWTRKLRSLEETVLYWEWMVQKGRRFGREIPNDYCEIHYEALVTEPRATLQQLGEFLDHDLDYDRIRSAGLGRLGESNSSFLEEAADAQFNPVQRWKQRLTPDQVASLEWHAGATLEEFGYPRTNPEHIWRPKAQSKLRRALIPAFLESKLWLKENTALRRLVSMEELELSEEATAQPNSASAAN